MEKVTLFCFAASYAVALGLELWHLYRRRPVHRLAANIFGGAGLLAHTLYLAVQRPPLGWQYGLFLVIAWVLAIFYLFGSLHHAKQAWGIFVLPIVLILVLLAALYGPGSEARLSFRVLREDETKLIGFTHGLLLIMAAVGVCVGFVASLMYLVQAHRLKEKMLPAQGMRLPSLERLEMMNRRALNIAFPLLTAGMILGIILLVRAADSLTDWTDPRVLISVPLWITFALMMYLRYGLHLRGKKMAILTIVAFALLILAITMPHMAYGGTA